MQIFLTGNTLLKLGFLIHCWGGWDFRKVWRREWYMGGWFVECWWAGWQCCILASWHHHRVLIVVAIPMLVPIQYITSVRLTFREMKLVPNLTILDPWSNQVMKGPKMLAGTTSIQPVGTGTSGVTRWACSQPIMRMIQITGIGTGGSTCHPHLKWLHALDWMIRCKWMISFANPLQIGSGEYQVMVLDRTWTVLPTANLAWNIVCTCNVHKAFLLPCSEWVGEMKLGIDIGHDVQNKMENQYIEVEFLSWVLPLAYMFLFENTIEWLKVICC